MNKRFVSLLLSLLLCLGLTTNALALEWDTDVDHGLYIPDESEWQDNITISNIVSQGSIDLQDGSFMAARVYYCKAPARITLLQTACVELGGSMQHVSITEDGQIFCGAQVEPTHLKAETDPDFGEVNGAGTYWDLPEGVYFMWSVNQGEWLFIVVGDPDNAQELTMVDGQKIYVSPASLGSYQTGGGDSPAPPATTYYGSTAMEVSLPADAADEYEILVFHEKDNTIEASMLTPGSTVSLWELRGDNTGNYMCFINHAETRITVFNIEILQAQKQYTDVLPGMYYYDPVSWAIAEGITNGTSNTAFSPNQTCSQAHILTFLWRAAGCPEPTGEADFAHAGVSAGQYFYKAFQWANERGVMTDLNLDPNAPCSRSDVVTYLWKLSGQPKGGSSSFTDVAKNAAYAKAVAWAVQEGITNGTSETTFGPAETCTRGQIVTFLHRYFVG